MNRSQRPANNVSRAKVTLECSWRAADGARQRFRAERQQRCIRKHRTQAAHAAACSMAHGAATSLALEIGNSRVQALGNNQSRACERLSLEAPYSMLQHFLLRESLWFGLPLTATAPSLMFAGARESLAPSPMACIGSDLCKACELQAAASRLRRMNHLRKQIGLETHCRRSALWLQPACCRSCPANRAAAPAAWESFWRQRRHQWR